MGNKQNKKKNNKEKDKNDDPIEETDEIIKKGKCKYKYNIVFVGESGVGTKTSLIKKIMEDQFIENREVQQLIYEKDDKEIILHLIDTHCEKEKRDSCNIYYKNADCIILGYDVTNKQSFDEIELYWFNQIKEKSKTNLIYLLGNKIDLKFEIVENKGKSFSDFNNLKFFAISVKHGSNIQNFINDLKYNLENNVKNDINNGINEIFYGTPSKESYKVVLLGDSGIGSKTSFINRVIDNRFDYNVNSTNGVSIASKTFELKNGKELIIEFFDTPGQEKYRALTKLIIQYSDVIILGYDITWGDSFRNIKESWYEYIKENSNTDLIYLLGNKIDLYEKSEVSESEVENYAEEKNMRYFEISCLKAIDFDKLFEDLINQLIKRKYLI
jgi:small GTP-binding protein